MRNGKRNFPMRTKLFLSGIAALFLATGAAARAAGGERRDRGERDPVEGRRLRRSRCRRPRSDPLRVPPRLSLDGRRMHRELPRADESRACTHKWMWSVCYRCGSWRCRSGSSSSLFSMLSQLSMSRSSIARCENFSQAHSLLARERVGICG